MKIYHLLEVVSWQSFSGCDSYSHPSLKTEGFIHFSRLEEVVRSADLYFKEQNELCLLEVDSEKVTVPIEDEWVSDRNAHFPHVMGELNMDAIDRVYQIKKEQGSFQLPSELRSFQN